jgi:hypothetical protein
MNERYIRPVAVSRMSGCARAAQAIARIDRVDADLQRQARRLELLAAVLGVDLGRLELVDAVDRRGFPITWDECVATGLDPTGETVA